MKKVLLLLSVLVTSTIFAQLPNYNWAKPFGGSSGDEGRSVVTDATGNVYSTGVFSGTVDFDPSAAIFNLSSAGAFDVYISKVDPAGNFVWAKKIGGTGNDNSWGIALDNTGNVFVSGNFNGTCDMDPGPALNNAFSAGQTDVFILKLDAAGNYVWAKTMGGTDFDGAVGIAIDANGHVVTTGSYRGTADFDPGVGTATVTSNGLDDIFISQLDNNGNFVMIKSIGGTGTDYGNAIATYASMTLFITGTFQNTADFDPGVGTTNLTSGGSWDAFVLRIDGGVFNWAKSMGGIGTEQGRSISIDNSGSVLTCGEFFSTVDFDPGVGTYTLTSAGNYDVFISKLDGGNGNFLMAKQIGGTGPDYSYSIKTTISDIYVSGTFQNTPDFDPGPGTFTMTSAGTNDCFIVKLNVIGNFNWAFKFGSTLNDGVYGISVDGNGGLYATGWFSNTVDFDPSAANAPLTSLGGTDAYLAKYVSCIAPPDPTNATPPASQTICAGSSTSLSANSGTNTINWFATATSTNVIGTGTLFATPVLAAGTYSYYAEASGCTTSFSRTEITVNVQLCTGINESNNNSDQLIKVYPNPAHSIIYVDVENIEENNSIFVTTMLGQIVMNERVNTKHTSLNIYDLPSGIYFIQLKNNSNIVSTYKFVKE